MTALRKTRPRERAERAEREAHLPRRARTCLLALVLPVGLFGCGTATPPGPDPSPHAVGVNDPAWIGNRPALPPPDADRINYDERTRTLTLYDLPRNDRWVVRLPGEPVGRQIGSQYRVPDVDPAEVLVCYTRPGQRPSVAVSVKQIQECGGAHVSFAAPR
jgi:cholesterol transport system auxiliary component